MCILNRKCHAWISLASVGLPYHGCLRDPEWLLGLEVLCCQSFCSPTVYVELPGKKLTCLQTISQGTFGYIDLALYETKENGSREVYVKRPILRGRSLLLEACVQMKVRECLQLAGFEHGAPRILQIFRLSDKSVCFAMEQMDRAITLDRFLDATPSVKLTTVLIECLIQLCSIVWHLGNDLGMNHRDLKPSNFLIVEHPVPVRRVITVDTEMLEIAASYSLTLIDFGFSCIGSPETHFSAMSLSSVYSTRDPCPKEGRDLFLFLGFMYMDIHDKMTDELRGLFERWLFIPDITASSEFCRELRLAKTDGRVEERQKWLYGIAGHEEIKEFQCCPLRIIQDLGLLRG